MKRSSVYAFCFGLIFLTCLIIQVPAWSFEDNFDDPTTYLLPVNDNTQWRQRGVDSGTYSTDIGSDGTGYSVRIVDTDPGNHAPGLASNNGQMYDLSSVVVQAEIKPNGTAGGGSVGCNVPDDTGENVCAGIIAGIYYDPGVSSWMFFIHDHDEYSDLDLLDSTSVSIDPDVFHEVILSIEDGVITATLDGTWTLSGIQRLPIHVACAGIGSIKNSIGDDADFSYDNFSCTVEPDTRHIVFHDVELVTDTPADEFLPKWSADGKKLTYMRRDDADPSSWNVWVKQVDPPAPAVQCTQNSDGTHIVGHPNLTPDSSHVLFVIRNTEGNGMIMRVPADGSGGVETILSEDNIECHSPSVMASENLLFYIKHQKSYTCPNIYSIQITDDGVPISGTENLMTNFSTIPAPVHSCDLDTEHDRMLFIGWISETDLDIFILNGVNDILDGNTLPPTSISDPRITCIASGPHFQVNAWFSADGSLVYYAEDVDGTFNYYYMENNPGAPWLDLLSGAHFEIFAVDPDSLDDRVKLNYYRPYSQSALHPSPDGTKLVFVSDNRADGDGVIDSDLYIVNLVYREEIVAADGGDIADGSGTTLTVPAGSLTEDTTITLVTPLPGDIPSPENLPLDMQNIALARVIETESETVEIISPLTLTIHYTDAEIAGLNELSLLIYVYNENTLSWEPLDGCVVDPVANTITAPLPHLSTFCVTGHQTTYEVGPTGDFLTISEALSVALEGDTIIVQAGTYDEVLTISTSLTIQSIDGAELTIVNGGMQLVADNITIEGFTINSGASMSGDNAGIYIVGGTSGHTISNTILNGPGRNNIPAYRGIILGYYVSDTLISDNTICDWTTGIYLNPTHPGANITITGNTLCENEAGIGSDGINDVLISENSFISNTEGWGVSNAGDNLQAHQNRFIGNGTGIYHYSGNQVDATNNWWGYSTGPAAGDIVGSVSSDPWLLSDPLAGPAPDEVWVDAALGNDANDGSQSSPVATIQRGIDLVDPGGTVNVAAGMYTPVSTILLNKNAITLNGPFADVDPRPSYDSIRVPDSVLEAVIDGTSTLDVILSIEADDIVINGFEVKSGTGDMIKQNTAHSGTIVIYCIVHDGQGDEGIQLKNATDAIVEYNYVFEIADPGDGISIADNSSYSSISYNEVAGIHGENAAIYIYGAEHMDIIGNLVRDSGTGGNDGIKIGDKGGSDADLQDVLVQENIVHDITQDGISVYMSDVIVEGNEIYNCYSENGAIYLSFEISNITVSDNSVHDNTLSTTKRLTAAGILLDPNVDAASVYINDNEIYNNTPYGLTNEAISVVDATNNWWGDNSGPGGGIVDPVTSIVANGAGDALAGDVHFDPWLTACTVYEDSEDGTTVGWDIFDNTPSGASIRNVYDADRDSLVIELSGDWRYNGYRLRNADGTDWNNTELFVIEWSMKCSEDIQVYVSVDTTAGHRFIYYMPVDENLLGTGEYVHHGLGSWAMDGQWHTFIRDLQADLEEAQPGVVILDVNGLLIRGSCRMDDIMLLYSMPPVLSVTDITVDEDALSAIFTITVNKAIGSDISVEYATADGTAVAGSDYVSTSGTATIPAGLTAVEVGVTLIDDSTYEMNETFSLILNNATNAVISDVTGKATIVDNELPPPPPPLTLYEDAEDGKTTGWDIFDNIPHGATITNVYDADRDSRVIQLSGYWRHNGYRLRNGNGTHWNNTDQFVIGWSMKCSEDIQFYVSVDTTAGHRFIYYMPVDSDLLGTGEYVHQGLGTGAMDGQWHSFTRDLQADLAEAQPGVVILDVNYIMIRGSCSVDDVMLMESIP